MLAERQNGMRRQEGAENSKASTEKVTAEPRPGTCSSLGSISVLAAASALFCRWRNKAQRGCVDDRKAHSKCAGLEPISPPSEAFCFHVKRR